MFQIIFLGGFFDFRHRRKRIKLSALFDFRGPENFIKLIWVLQQFWAFATISIVPL